jgi:hypothetical protein
MLYCLWCWLFGHKFYSWSWEGHDTYVRIDRDYCERCGVVHPRLAKPTE